MATNQGFITTLGANPTTQLVDGTDVIHSAIIMSLSAATGENRAIDGFNISQSITSPTETHTRYDVTSGHVLRNGKLEPVLTKTGATGLGTTLSTGTSNTNFDWYGLIVVDSSNVLQWRHGTTTGKGNSLVASVAELTGGDIPVAIIKYTKASLANVTNRHIQYLTYSQTTREFSVLNGGVEKLRLKSDGTILGLNGTFTMPSSTGTLALTSDITTYTLPAATGSALGGIKVGNNLSISNGVLAATDSNTTYSEFNASNAGLVPVRDAGATSTKFLREDGDWVIPTDADTIYTHPDTDGTKHVPATSTTNNGKVLTAGSTAGSLSWTDKTVNEDTNKYLSDLALGGTDNSTLTATVTGGSNVTLDLTQYALKTYADTIKQGLDTKDSVRVATTANITLSGTQTIDTIAVIADNRVLVKNQTTASQNGIYLCKSGTWVRTDDANANADVTSGLYVWVEEGVQGDTGWILTTNNPITVGTTDLTFAQFSGSATQLLGGDGITKTGNSLSISTTGVTNAMLAGSIAQSKITNLTSNLGDKIEDLSDLSITATAAEINILDDGLAVSDIPNLAAGKITSDSFHVDRIPTLAKSKISTTGTWVEADIPTLAKSKISTTGTWVEADIPTLTKSKISTTGTWVAADIPNLNTSKINAGTFADARIASATTWNAKQATISVGKGIDLTGTILKLDLDDLVAESAMYVGTTNPDYISFYDTSVSGTRKITPIQFMAAIGHELIPTLPADKIGSGEFVVGRIPDLAQSKITGLGTTLSGKVPTSRTIAGRSLENDLVVRINTSTGKLEVNDGTNTSTIQDTAGTPVDVVFDNRKTLWTEVSGGAKPSDNATVGGRLGSGGTGNILLENGSTKATEQLILNTNTTAANVDLGSVDNLSAAAIRAGVTKANVGLDNVLNQAQITTFKQTSIPAATAAGDIWIDTDDNNKQYRATAAGDDVIGSGEWIEVTPDKTAIGLGSVDNTADTAKPVSTAAQTALNLKSPIASPTFTGTVAGITKTHVGLANVDNTTDALKPVSTAQGVVNALKAPIASPTFTGTVAGVTKTHVGLANVDNTTDAVKQTATLSAATKADVGLANVDNTTDAAKQTATLTAATKSDVGLANVDNDSTSTIRSAITLAKAVSGNTKTLSLTNGNSATIPLEFEDGATKNQVFRQSAAPTALSIGDIWVDTDDNKVYSASATGTGDWELVTAAYTDAEKTKLGTVASNATANTGDVAKTGTINANEFARWSDATTLEARTAAEVKSDLGLGTAATLSGTGAVADANAGLVTGNVVYDYIIAQNFGSGSGDITDVIAGSGLTGGASSGSATLNVIGGTGITANANDIAISSGAALTNLGGGSGSTYLKKDGTWADPDTDTNTTYGISAVDGSNSDEEQLRITGSDASTDHVVFEAGTGLSIARSGDKITYTNTVTNTDTQLSQEQIEDYVDNVLTAGSNVTLSYNDTAGTLTVASTDTNTWRGITAGGNTLASNETLAFTAGSNMTITESGGAVTLTATDTNTDTNTWRGITAGGNTLSSSETLAFTAGSNVTITESAGAVTIASTDTNTQLTLLDQDNMSSNSATAAASQQSVKAYVDTEVSGLVASAPAALDTLNELAAALGDDAAFATTTATNIGLKLAKASNLSDLANAGTARTNLGLGTGAVLSTAAIANAGTGLATADQIHTFVTDFGYTTNTGTTTASNSQTFTNKGGNISQWTNNSGYITSFTNTVDMGAGFVLEDGDGTEVTITENKEVKFIDGTNIDINWTDTDSGADGDPYDLTFNVSNSNWDTAYTHSQSAHLALGTTSTTALAGDTTTISNGQASAITANTAKTGITSGQASAITANTAKITYPSADSTKVGYISITQAVDLDTIESNVATNNAKVSDINHNTDRYVNSAAFNTGTGVLTLTRAGSDTNTVTVDLDDRYSLAAVGGEANQLAFSNVAVNGQTTVAADTKTDTLNLVGAGGTTITTTAGSDTVTFTSSDTNTQNTYTAGSGLGLSSFEFSHSDTSSQASVNGSGRTYIQDITLDTYGHVTGLATATETVTNTDTQLTNAQVIAKLLTGISTSTGGAVGASDSILVGMGKLEKRVALNDAKVTDVNHNVTTNLGVTTSTTTIDVTSSDGTDATLPVATTSAGGVMSKALYDYVIANNAKVSDINHNTDINVNVANLEARLPQIDTATTIGNGVTITAGGDLTVTGDLLVSGDTVTMNTATMNVEDPLISMASGNAADSVDVGFYAKYVSSGTKYAGLFRDASDSDKWKLFATTGNSHAVPTTTVNTTSGFTLGTLVADTFEGALSGNATTATTASAGDSATDFFSSGTIAAARIATLNQSTTGNAATVTTNANLTGDITSSGNATAIASGVIINADVKSDAAIAYSKLGTIPTWNQSTTGNAATASAVAYTGLTGTVPTWNQNTTGSAASLSATLAVASGGTGLTSLSTLLNSNVTLSNVDLSDLTDMTQSWVTASDEFVVLDNGTQKRKLSSEIFGSNAFNSTAFTTNTGTVTSVGTNTGLSGTVTGSGSLSLALDDLADMTQTWVTSTDEFIVLDDGTQKKKLSSEIFGSNAFNSTAFTTLALGETSSTAYRGDRGKIGYDHSQVSHAPSNATDDQTAAEIATLFSWSANPESGATADQTATEIANLALTGYSTAGSESNVVAADKIREAFGKLEFRVNVNDDKVSDVNHNATHTGDVTGATVLTITAGAVDNAHLAGSIANAKLSNSAITIDGSSTSLGGSITTTNTTTTADVLSALNADWGGNKTFGTQTDDVLTIGGGLTVSGDLIVSGTTSTINSTTVTVDDPIFTLGGDTAPTSDDNKDRGIEFRYHTGSAAAVGFMGYDDSASKFTMLTGATNTSEVFSGTKGTLVANLEGNVTGALTGNADTATKIDSIANNAIVVTSGAQTIAGTKTFSSAIAGSVTGTAATVTGAAQTAITSVGELTTLTVDNLNLNSNRVTTVGAQDLILSTNSGSSTGTISILAGNTNHIKITPATTGDVKLQADQIIVGDDSGAAAAIITTDGAGDLTLSTNKGTNSGTIVITDGADGAINITPNGTGATAITKLTATNATLVTPALGTPASGVLTNATGLPTTSLTGTVTNAQLAGSIANAKLASGIDAGKLTTGTLPIARIATGAVTSAKLAGSIAYSKLSLTGAVLNADLASGISATKLTTGTIPIARLGTGNVDTTHLADDAVDSDKIGAGEVDNAALATSGLSASKLTIGTLPDARYNSGISALTEVGAKTARSLTLTAAVSDNTQVWFKTSQADEEKYFDTGINLAGEIISIGSEEVRVISAISLEVSEPISGYDYGLKVDRGVRGTTAASSYSNSTTLSATSNRTIQTTATGSGSAISISMPEFSGASSNVASVTGLVPKATTSDTAKYLRGDGTWQTVSSGSSGTVTSVTAGTGMTQSGTSTVNPTLNVIGGTGITANTNDIAIDSTVTTLTGTQTLTNKTLTSPTLSGLIATTLTAGSEQVLISDTSDTALFKVQNAGTGSIAEFHDQASDSNYWIVDQYGRQSIKGSIAQGYDLTVAGAVKTSGVFVSAGNAALPQLAFSGDTNTGLYSVAADTIGFTTGGTESLTIAGLITTFGTGSGTAQLKSNGNQNLYLTTGHSSTGSINMVAGADERIILTPHGTGYVSIGGGTGIRVVPDGTASLPSYTWNNDSNTGMYRGGTDILGFSTAGTERMTISASGVVNIAGSLTVAGSAVGGASDLDGLTDVISNITNFTDSILISPDGAAPPHGVLATATGNTGIGKDVFAALTSGDDNVGIGKNALKLLTTGTGNIAIGRDTLGLAYTTQTNTVAIGHSAGRYIGNGAGNVAIGALANATANDASNNVSIGQQSMYGLSGVANNNVGIGAYSLRTLSTGDDNVAIGYYAGYAVTTGSDNIAIGRNALDAADTENDNIAIGYDALGGAIAGGEKNVSIGNYSGDALTSGDYNVFVGHKAGTGVTTGQANVIVGNQEYTSSVMTGSFNVHVGQRAGEDTTDGTYNTLVGASSGSSISSGDYNTTLGESAAFRVTTEHGNVALGYHAGYQAKGNYNINIGYKAGQQAGTIGTGINNIYIGAETANAVPGAGSGNVAIGKGEFASATGDDQLLISSGDGDVDWITGDSAGKIQIGALTSPVTTGMLTVSRDDTTATGPTLLLLDGDDDANAGPTLKLYRDSASPADNDILGNIGFNGEDSAGGERTYAAIKAIAKDVTSGTNDGILEFKTMVAGTQEIVLELEDGAVTVNEAYTLPTTVTGANDRVLTAQTDGSTAWAAAGGSNTDGAAFKFTASNRVPMMNGNAGNITNTTMNAYWAYGNLVSFVESKTLSNAWIYINSLSSSAADTGFIAALYELADSNLIDSSPNGTLIATATWAASKFVTATGSTGYNSESWVAASGQSLLLDSSKYYVMMSSNWANNQVTSTPYNILAWASDSLPNISGSGGNVGVSNGFNLWINGTTSPATSASFGNSGSGAKSAIWSTFT